MAQALACHARAAEADLRAELQHRKEAFDCVTHQLVRIFLVFIAFLGFPCTSEQLYKYHPNIVLRAVCLSCGKTAV